MDAVSDRRIEGEGTSEEAWRAWLSAAAIGDVDAVTLMAGRARAVVVAPHPDDELLVAGGLMVLLAQAGIPVQVVAVTDGAASHPGSSIWPPSRLARMRPLESRQALRCLGLDVEPLRLGLPDGGLRALGPALLDRLQPLVRPDDLIVTTWRLDGHPDHEATGDACVGLAARSGAGLLEVPVWAWHWAAPGDPRIPWQRARRLQLSPALVDRKRRALHSHASQLEPDASTGAGPILPAKAVARASWPFEVVLA
ncbi:PIG-L deacetylase family protein [Variovorax sp. KK3]|uniref:PIG-L deacetylase family protein n=1 Tax=Variovorax sp. KK3 TaxID=1855728 RepID=UPI00097BC431|nr:PIG-L family deacetylase [Variovorax sp. KK3]